MPEPPGFVVKKGTNRFDAVGKPAPSSSTHNENAPPSIAQPTVTAPPVCCAASTPLRTTLMRSCSS